MLECDYSLLDRVEQYCASRKYKTPCNQTYCIVVKRGRGLLEFCKSRKTDLHMCGKVFPEFTREYVFLKGYVLTVNLDIH